LRVKVGDFVGRRVEGKLGCPVLRVVNSGNGGFALRWPVAWSRPEGLLSEVGVWSKIEGDDLRDPALGCACYRCAGDLSDLAFCV
jgi:hypothetical protein